MKPWTFEGPGLLQEVRELKTTKDQRVFGRTAKFLALGVTVEVAISEEQFNTLKPSVGKPFACGGNMATKFDGSLELQLTVFKPIAA